MRCYAGPPVTQGCLRPNCQGKSKQDARNCCPWLDQGCACGPLQRVPGFHAQDGAEAAVNEEEIRVAEIDKAAKCLYKSDPVWKEAAGRWRARTVRMPTPRRRLTLACTPALSTFSAHALTHNRSHNAQLHKVSLEIECGARLPVRRAFPRECGVASSDPLCAISARKQEGCLSCEVSQLTDLSCFQVWLTSSRQHPPSTPPKNPLSGVIDEDIRAILSNNLTQGWCWPCLFAPSHSISCHFHPR